MAFLLLSTYFYKTKEASSASLPPFLYLPERQKNCSNSWPTCIQLLEENKYKKKWIGKQTQKSLLWRFNTVLAVIYKIFVCMYENEANNTWRGAASLINIIKYDRCCWASLVSSTEYERCCWASLVSSTEYEICC